MWNWNGGYQPVFAFAGGADAEPQHREPNRLNMHFAGTPPRNSRDGRSGYAQGRGRRQAGVTSRGIVLLLLIFLLPPVGVMLMWRRGVYEMRGRIFMTLVAMALMTAMLTLVFSMDRVVPVSPQPVRASLRTPIQKQESLNALSNLDQLLAGVTDSVDVEGMTGIHPPEEVLNAQQEEIPADVVVDEATLYANMLAKVVYSVRSGAKYYHTSSECNGQSNKRALTVEQALNENLSPCTRCNPPSPDNFLQTE